MSLTRNANEALSDLVHPFLVIGPLKLTPSRSSELGENAEGWIQSRSQSIGQIQLVGEPV